MYTYYFEKLKVWENSKELVKKIYEITKSFPADEKFNLISQIRRAAISVPTNISEGSSRSTKKDQAYFTTIAFSSLMELLNLLIISSELKILYNADYQNIREDIEKIGNQLNALKKSQLSPGTKYK